MNFLKSAWAWLSGLVGNSPSVRPLIFAAIILFICLATYCHESKADELHLEIGASVIHGTGPYLGLVYKFGSNKTMGLESGFQFWGKTTHYEGASIPNNWAPNVLIDVAKGPVSMGLGVTYLQLTDRLDGSHANLSIKLDYSFSERFGVVIRHVSNAGTVAPNVGRNALALDILLNKSQ